MRLLVLNAGSSSLKFDLFEPGGGAPPPGQRTVTGAVERIGGRSVMTTRLGPAGREEAPVEAGDHAQATVLVLDWLKAARALAGGPDAVAHRVVHAGERFSAPAQLDDAVLSAIAEVAPLAPLHNEPAIAAIRASRRTLGGQTPMVAVFDTTFHRSLPPRAAIYALPRAVAERHGIRRYGFHGLAHRSLVERWAFSGEPATRARLVTLQLGNGASAAAVAHGRSVDTTMGFTPLEGLAMGTNSGDLDPAIPGYLARQEHLSLDQVDALLNGSSGLLGVSGTSADMADLLRAEEAGDERAALAIDLFCYRARKTVGAFMAALGGADALVFGGGIGERSPAVRARICEGMAWCGLVLDHARNTNALGCDARISGNGSKPSAWVVAVDEASVIATDALACLERTSH